MSNGNASELGQAIQDVTEKAQLLIREEIELAKAEVSEKVGKLIRGIVVGAAAAIFALVGLLFLLHAAGWGLWSLLTNDEDGGMIWLGFAVLALILFVLGAVAGLLALRFVKRGTPPTPQLAIEEAQLIRQTISTARPAQTGTPAPRPDAQTTPAGGARPADGGGSR